MKTTEATLARVLVVDAVPESAGLIKLILRKYGGNEVLHADSINKAIELIATQSPELVLLDADLPNDTALRFCREIGRHEQTSGIPIILFSEKKDRSYMVRGFEAGAVDFMFKPIFPMELAARARSHILLKRQTDALERKAVEQKELVQVMCHDITGPVSASVNLIEMSRDDPQMLNETLDLVLVALNKVTELTDLVRKMRSFEEGKMEWNLVPVPLKAAVKDSLSTLRQRLIDKAIDVKINIADDLRVIAEPVSLVNSVIANLLTNAVKFSNPESSIEIEASGQGDTIVLAFQDHGIGMPAKIQENLFNIRVPTSRPGTSKEPGTGFGMPLVLKFVTGYGGRMTVRSKDIEEHPNSSGTRIELNFQAAPQPVENVGVGVT